MDCILEHDLLKNQHLEDKTLEDYSLEALRTLQEELLWTNLMFMQKVCRVCEFFDPVGKTTS